MQETERDLSARLLKAEAMQQRLDDAQRIAQMGSFEEDFTTGALWWSKGMYDLLGYAPYEFPPKAERFLEHISEPARSAIKKRRETLLHQGEIDYTPSIFEITTTQGERRWLQASIDTIDDKKGNLLKMRGVILDITETKRLRDELTRLNHDLEERIKQEVAERLQVERRFRQLFEYSYDAFWLIDYRSRKVIDCNDTAQKLLGYTKEELEGIPPYHFLKALPPLTRKSILHGVAAKRHDVYEVQFRSRSGKELWGQMSLATLTQDDSSLLLCMFRDLSAQHHLEEEQREQQSLLIQQSKLAAMGEMIGSIAHQWRQPINALAVKIQDIDLAYENGELGRDYIDGFIEESMELISYMSHTIDDFRNFFRPSKTATRFTLAEELHKSLAMIQNQARLVQVACEVHSELPEDFMMVGYRNELKQVLLNLLKNALDSIEERTLKESEFERRIDLFLRLQESQVEIIVQDSGGGIPPAVEGKIFDPYFTTKEQGKGTGIGLYMSKTIVEKNMKGQIRAENRPASEGKGARLRLLIPREIL